MDQQRTPGGGAWMGVPFWNSASIKAWVLEREKNKDVDVARV